MIYDAAEGILCLMQLSLLHPLDRLGIEPKLQLHCLRVMTTRLPIYRWSKRDTPQGCNSGLPSILCILKPQSLIRFRALCTKSVELAKWVPGS